MACGRVRLCQRHHRPISGRMILTMGRFRRHASYSDIAAAIPALAQTEIRADPSRKEALRKQYQPHAEQERLGEVRIATGAGGPARARSEAEI